MAREVTNKFLENYEDGMYSADYIIKAFCCYLSEDEMRDFIRTNEIEIGEDDD